MDKRVIFAVAGSGKTTYIINQLNLNSNALIITYTINNVRNIRNGILKKFGYFPQNIWLHSYFTFLHSFCYKPFLYSTYKTKGIDYDHTPSRYATGDARYINSQKRIYSNRLSKLLIDNHLENDINERLSKYFTNIYIDEIQDFAGNDFNLIKSISAANVNLLFVGDFYQHTFDTSRDNNVNAKLHKDYLAYQKQFENMGLTVDLTTLLKSWRCSPTVCAFIKDNLGIDIESHRTDSTQVNWTEDIDTINSILENNDIVKLFYQKHIDYNCFSQNWGGCKGENRYKDVCVVLNNGTYGKYNSNTLITLAPTTKNKLYVACSRTNNDLYFFPEKLID